MKWVATWVSDIENEAENNERTEWQEKGSLWKRGRRPKRKKTKERLHHQKETNCKQIANYQVFSLKIRRVDARVGKEDQILCLQLIRERHLAINSTWLSTLLIIVTSHAFKVAISLSFMTMSELIGDLQFGSMRFSSNLNCTSKYTILIIVIVSHYDADLFSLNRTKMDSSKMVCLKGNSFACHYGKMKATHIRLNRVSLQRRPLHLLQKQHTLNWQVNLSLKWFYIIYYSDRLPLILFSSMTVFVPRFVRHVENWPQDSSQEHFQNTYIKYPWSH